ncbi:MAG: MATE family efflux transporter [Polyangiaceae bacterium]
MGSRAYHGDRARSGNADPRGGVAVFVPASADAAIPEHPEAFDAPRSRAHLGAFDLTVHRSVLEVLRLAWPVIAHSSLLTMVFVVDRVLCGRRSPDALASLQLSTVAVWAITSIFTACSAGTLAIAGRAFGARDALEVGRTVRASLAMAAIAGVAVVAVALPLLGPSARWLLPSMGASVEADVLGYLYIVIPTLPLAFVEVIAASSLQAIGDTRSPVVAAASANVVNLVLSLLLVFGWMGMPALGVRGAAIGAAAAAVVQTVITLVALARRSDVPLATPISEHDREIVSRLVRVSGPAALDKVAYAGGYLAFSLVLGLIGPAAMAANQAIVSVEAFSFLSAEGLGVAAGVLVAQKLGANDASGAQAATRSAGRIGVALLSALGLAFLLGSSPLLAVFSSAPDFSAAARPALVVAALAQPWMAYALVARSALRGAGATRTVLYVSAASTLLVRLPLAYGLGVVAGLGLVGAWVACLLDWALQAALFERLLRGGALERARV